MEPHEEWLEPTPSGLRLHVHVVPGSARPGLAGLHGGRLRVRLRARAREGAANRELVSVLAAALGVPRAKVELVRGATARRKTLRIDGDPEAAAARLRALVC